ncbi:MAG: [acyl-carrier-protein] S-malonyltransferase [Gaiellaceae bacterium]|nr:[acyl-carrier-protein] S-malonyltransferase [Gaiellaceae bacterium]
MSVAFLFPGQGAQEVGMGAAFAAASPAARAAYDEASAAVGFDVAELSFEGPIERLSATEMTQPALTATSIACLAAVREAGFQADFVIGHSVGEYAALVAAAALSVSDAMVLVRERGLATAEAAVETPGAMAAVIGLPDEKVEELCAAIDGVWPANYNCPGQLVVSGTEAGVGALIEAAQEAGARRAVRLNVSGGFHSPLTAVAERRLRPALEAVTFHDPVTPFFSTVTTQVEEHGADLAEILVKQLTAPVRFTQAVEELVRRGVTQFVEIGSGNVLSGLVRRIDRSVQAIAVSGPDGLAKLEAARG